MNALLHGFTIFSIVTSSTSFLVAQLAVLDLTKDSFVVQAESKKCNSFTRNTLTYLYFTAFCNLWFFGSYVVLFVLALQKKKKWTKILTIATLVCCLQALNLTLTIATCLDTLARTPFVCLELLSSSVTLKMSILWNVVNSVINVAQTLISFRTMVVEKLVESEKNTSDRRQIAENVLKKSKTFKFQSAKKRSRRHPINNIVGDTDTCPICLTSYENNDLLTLMVCNHAFHRDCIFESCVKIALICPICKISFQETA